MEGMTKQAGGLAACIFLSLCAMAQAIGAGTPQQGSNVDSIARICARELDLASASLSALTQGKRDQLTPAQARQRHLDIYGSYADVTDRAYISKSIADLRQTAARRASTGRASQAELDGYWLSDCIQSARARQLGMNPGQPLTRTMVSASAVPAPAPLPSARSQPGAIVPPQRSTPLSPAQIADCDQTIKSTQIASQRWSGSVAQVSMQLGRFQRALFTGRCAGHPQAAAYVRGADRMITQGGGVANGSTQGSVAGSAGSTTGAPIASTMPQKGATPAPAGRPAPGSMRSLTSDGRPCLTYLGYQRDRVQPLRDTIYAGFIWQNICTKDIVVRAQVRQQDGSVKGYTTTIFKAKPGTLGKGDVPCLTKLTGPGGTPVRGHVWQCERLIDWYEY